MFVNFRCYRVPEGVRVRSLQNFLGEQIVGSSLEELGVKEVMHFGSFAAGEMLMGKTKDGRDISFLVDRWTPEWHAILPLDGFVALAGIDFKDTIPGHEVARGFGFDPGKCRVVVDGRGVLTISQEGYHTTFSASPGFWEER